jgi:Arc/MetJ family transcription regulator
VNKHKKSGQVVDHRVDFLNKRAALKTELPHLTGEELTKQLQLKDDTAVSWGKQ